MYLDKYAEAFAKAGFASIVYDNRNCTKPLRGSSVV
jgi:hypothetical protein